MNKNTLDKAQTLHRAGQYSEAEKLYRELLAEDAESAEIHHLLGILKAQTDHFEQALELIDQAITLKPKVPAFHNSKGNVLLFLQRYQEAGKTYQAEI